MNIRQHKKIMAVAIITVIGILLSSYGIATFLKHTPKTYNLTIYLNDGEDTQTQLDEIGSLLRDFYMKQGNMVMPTIAISISDSGNETQVKYVTTFTIEQFLNEIVNLLESHGYRVTYTEERSPV